MKLENRVAALEAMLSQLLMDKYDNNYTSLQRDGTPAERLFMVSVMNRRLDKDINVVTATPSVGFKE